MSKIIIKNGLESTIPSLDKAEFGVTTDTDKVFFGGKEGNVELANKKDLDNVNVQLADATQHEQENANFGTNKNSYSLKPMVTFIDDDGRSEVYTKLLPLYTAKGVPFVSCVSSKKIGTTGHMTLEQIQEIQSKGNEIASHGENHWGLTNYINEIGGSHKVLNNMGLKVDNLVYVGGDFNLDVIKESKKFYKSAVRVGGGVNIAPVRQFALSRFYIATTTTDIATPQVFNGIQQNNTLESYKAIVDYAFANNAWLIFGTHCWYSEFDATQEDYLKQTIDYIKSKNMPIVTLNEGVKKYGNKIDIGDTSFVSDGNFIVGANGDILSTGLDKRLANYPKIATEVQNIATQSIPVSSNVTVVVPISATNMANYDIAKSAIVAMPYGGVEPNVIWDVHVTSSKEVRLVLYNLSTSNSRGTSARNWAFKIIY